MRSGIGSSSLLLSVLLCVWNPQPVAADPPAGWFNGYAWSTCSPSGNDGDNLDVVGISGDGNTLLAGEDNGRVYLSHDSGQTWSLTQPNGAAGEGWHSCSLSANGSVILLGTSVTHVYLSTNSGAAWTQLTLGGNNIHDWSVQVSSDGNRLLACVGDGRVYVSTDKGAHWNEVQPIGNQSSGWREAALSGNGNAIVLIDNDYIYRSTDFGQQWTTLQPPADASQPKHVATSSDGSTVLLADDMGCLFLSVDGGTTWTTATPAHALLGSDEWDRVALSSDGTRMAALTSWGLYTSSDAGATWYQRYFSTNSWEYDLQDLGMSADGTRIIVGQEADTVYVGLPNQLPTVNPADAYTKDIITIAVNGMVTDPGASEIIARGVCWNTSGNPTVADYHAAIEGGLGGFTAEITNCPAGSTYHIRTYATNSQGTAYGRETTVTLPTLDQPFWARVQPVETSATWMTGGMSGNGKVMIIQEGESSKVYVSRDYGSTWNAVDLSMSIVPFIQVALFSEATLSYDGSTILMPVISGIGLKSKPASMLLLSKDSGQTWTQVMSNSSGYISPASISNDGQILHALNLFEDECYTSTDGGTQWTTTSPGLDMANLWASDDGSRLVAVGETNVGNYNVAVLTSTDGGQTWNTLLQSEDEFFALGCSADGTHIYTAGDGASMASHDGGATWAALKPTGETKFTGIRISCSADGQTVLTGGIGSLYLSNDAGTTWSPQLYSVDDIAQSLAESAIWDTIDISADGKQFFAARYDGKLYVGGYPTLQRLTTAEATDVSETTAVVGGAIDVQSFVPISARGVCWNLTGTPSLDDTHTTDGTGGGTFSTTLTGLKSGTTYHVRAYAVSPLGTTYGDEKTFTTSGTALAPDLFVSIESGDSSGGSGNQQYAVGQQAQFIVHITNRGNGGASSITVIIPIPEGTEFVSAEPIVEPSGHLVPKDVAVSGNQVIITLPQLAPNEQVSVRLVLRALVAGQVSLTAQATSAEQTTPAAADNFVVNVGESYYEIVSVTPLCGAFGVAPLLCTVFWLGCMRRRGGM